MTKKTMTDDVFMHTVNVAVVGCGYVANGHLRAWRKARLAKVVAVSDLNETLARNTAQLWKIPSYYVSLSELTKNSNIDLIDICTPPQTHATLAIQAMQAGFNVLIEKPMTMTLKDAEKIVECQKTTSVKAGVMHNWLFETPVLEASSFVENGCLGEVFDVEVQTLNTKHDSMASNQRHWCHNLPGGRFGEMLAHPIYLIRHFLGEIKLRDVQVSKIGDYPWMKSDELLVTYKAGNKFGRAYASFNAPRDAVFINLYGTEAILKLELINTTTNILRKRKNRRLEKAIDSLTQAAQLMKSTINNAMKIGLGCWSSGLAMYIELFTKSLIDDSKPPVTVEEGLEVVKALEEVCGIIEKAEKTHQTKFG